MRSDDFPANDRGGARRVVGADYVAYFPNPLPRSIEFTTEVVRALDRATGALHRLAGVGRLLPNPDLLIAPHLRLEAVQSSKIEGTRSEVDDLLRFEAGDLESIGELAADAREVGNYISALDHGRERLHRGFPLSMRLLREVHERLLTGVRGNYATPGDFRRSQNWIGGSSPGNAAFVPPPVEQMQVALDDLEKYLHEEPYPLLIQLALIHYQFEVIHPFLDGNGRLGRLLIPLMLMNRAVLPQPLLYLSVYFERNRERYYELLMSTSRTGDLDPWILFFLDGVAQQSADAEERTVRLVELQAATRRDLMAEGASTTTVRAAESLFNRPYTSAKVLAELLAVSRPTAQSAIDVLVRRGDLVESTGRQRNRFYTARQIFDAVYGTPADEPDELPLF